MIESGWNENELVLRAIVPGVTQDSLKITAQSNQLILEGERKAPEPWRSGAHLQIAYGKFYAAFPLPQNLNVDQVKCHLHDGVLDVHLPVAKETKPRQIPIESAKSQQANRRLTCAAGETWPSLWPGFPLPHEAIAPLKTLLTAHG